MTLVLSTAGGVHAQVSDAPCHELVQSPPPQQLVRHDLDAVSVAIPASWLNRGPDCPAGIYVNPAALDSLRGLDELGEWDTEYEAVAGAVMAGADLVGQFGAEPWAGSFYGDLQVRVYRSSSSVRELGRRVREEGRTAAAGFADGAVQVTDGRSGRWTRHSIRFPLWFRDYGGSAVVDFVSVPCHSGTVTLVFMHEHGQDDEHWNHEPLIEQIAGSIECGS